MKYGIKFTFTNGKKLNLVCKNEEHYNSILAVLNDKSLDWCATHCKTEIGIINLANVLVAKPYIRGKK